MCIDSGERTVKRDLSRSKRDLLRVKPLGFSICVSDRGEGAVPDRGALAVAHAHTHTHTSHTHTHTHTHTAKCAQLAPAILYLSKKNRKSQDFVTSYAKFSRALTLGDFCV